MKRIRKILLVTFVIIISYLGIGYLFHLVVFPEYKPELSDYFRPGDIFYSQEEGLRQTVIRQGGWKTICKD